MGVRSDELLRDLDSKKKTGAGGGDIETGSFFRADFFLHETGGGRKKHVGRGGRDQNKIDVFRLNFRLPECLKGRFCRHVAGELVFCSDTPFFDAGARGDPFVRRIDDSRKIRVGQSFVRHITAGADNRNRAARFTGVRSRARARLSFHDNGESPRRYAG